MFRLVEIAPLDHAQTGSTTPTLDRRLASLRQRRGHGPLRPDLRVRRAA